MVKTPSFQSRGEWVPSLVRELRFLMLCEVAKKKTKKKKTKKHLKCRLKRKTYVRQSRE